MKLLHHTFAKSCTMNATHPPVKILLTDGLEQGFIRPVEQVELIYSFSIILLHHLLFLPEYKMCINAMMWEVSFSHWAELYLWLFLFHLPLKDLPEKGVLDPLDCVYFALGHCALEQFGNRVILLG